MKSCDRLKRAIAERLCMSMPRASISDPGPSASPAPAPEPQPPARTRSLSSTATTESHSLVVSSGHRLSRTLSRPSKRICAICLESMKAGHGHALFTAECSHSFHFHCISSNVRHGNLICPVCRAKWTQIPFLGPPHAEPNPGRARVNPIGWQNDDGHMAVVRVPVDFMSRDSHLFRSSEPRIFNDDEPVSVQSESTAVVDPARSIEIKLVPEYSAVEKSAPGEEFSILIHLKAPAARRTQSPNRSSNNSTGSATDRVPIDLVTVLDVSGSMGGAKLGLLKHAMEFMIQNLSAADRLCVIAFSSTARRLFHLRRMTDVGRQHALHAVNSLVAGGCTNIGAGLEKGAKVLRDRRQRNPVCSIILFSDGQDSLLTGVPSQSDYESLVPSSILQATGNRIPIHAFGFGEDHDSAAMHSIAEASTGTFSFIEAETAIQDSFAQCIGGLLSVVVQEAKLNIACVQEGVVLSSIKSGNYASLLAGDGRSGSIDVGDLYAEEERDFLVMISVPPTDTDTSFLLRVGCCHKDPVTKETVVLEGEELRIERPEFTDNLAPSILVDREKNRFRAVTAMSAAKAAAERGEFEDAVAMLQNIQRMLIESPAGRSGDQLCLSLAAEMREMQVRMADQQRYETTGRAYMLSGLSSHEWQRATTRGEMTDGNSHHSYQTPSMVDMLHRSQNFGPPSSAPRRSRSNRSSVSFSAQLS